MEKKLKLELEKPSDEKGAKVGISKEVMITDRRGSSLTGSISLITGCDSYQMLEKEVTAIKEELDALLKDSKKLFGSEGTMQGIQDVDESKSAEEVWNLLSAIKAPEALSASFNGMSHEKRVEVADYVLSHCNVFSGPASVFSMRYNSEEGLLE
jgi:peptidyl-tRNA hydrolase